MAEPQLITDVVRNGILDHLSESPVIPVDPILKLGKLDKVVDSLTIIWKGDCNDSIFIIIFW